MKRLSTILAAVLVLAFAATGVNYAVKDNQQLKVKEIQLKSTDAKLKELQLKYDVLNKDLDQELHKSTTNEERVKQLEQEKQQLEQQKGDLERQLQAKLDAKNKAARQFASTVTGTATASAAPANSGGWHYDCRPQKAGVQAAVEAQGLGGQWTYIDYIFSHESCHDPGRLNSGGCAGLGQRCPGSTLRNVCGANDIGCQVAHFNSYAVGRYGSWAAAYSFWLKNHWW